jgi:fucose permease
MLGPLLPGFAARGGWNDAQSGSLFAAQFLASVAAAAAVGPLSMRIGYLLLVRTGLVVIALGCAGCAVASPIALPVCVAVVGCGLGCLIPAANWFAASAQPGKSAAAVMWMNMSWSVGSVAAPLAIIGLRGAFLWSLAAAALVTAAIVVRGPSEAVPSVRTVSASSVSALTVIAAALLFLYSGTESALGGWLSTYARRIPHTGELWTILPSIFWSGILFGRVASPALLQRLSTARLLALSMAGAFVATAALLAANDRVTLAVATTVAGLSMAAVFPLVVSQYADRTGGGASSGLLFVAASLGGSVIPPFVGILAGATGTLRAGFMSLLVWLAVVMMLERRLSR